MPNQITEDEIRLVYRAVLRRDPENEAIVKTFASLPITLEDFIRSMIRSEEFSESFQPRESRVAPEYALHNGAGFLSPDALRRPEDLPSRILLVGSCFLDSLRVAVQQMKQDRVADLLHIDMHPDVPAPAPWDAYRYQIGQVPLRAILPDADYFDWMLHGYADPSVAERVFGATCDRLRDQIRRCAVWSDKLPVFMLNYLCPMQSVNGRLFGAFDLRDNRFFIRELNRELERIVRQLPNVHVLDADACAAVMGRRFFQEDSVWMYNHGGLINDSDHPEDADRIEKQYPVSRHYRLAQPEFLATLLSEADAAYRSLRGIGAVKMVCVDLDDTLWRGVLAEADYIDDDQVTGGWPLGMLEALAALRRRGILLCMLSKNDEATVRDIWRRVYGRKFPLDEFAITKINWNSKADNLREAIAEANILPGSVVFLDDNPVERNTIATAFPDVRVIGSSHYYWKRILMWSAETQGAVITDESNRRTDMVKAQITRETTRTTMSRDQFLRDLDLRVIFNRIASRDDPRFPRVVELINKTNQFNTTGRRWTAEEIEDVCRRGIVLTADVIDRFSHYGLVAIALCLNGVLEQMVMSCRVLGMEVEQATISAMTGLALRTVPVVRARMIDTRANLLSRDLFKKCGWTLADDVWETSVANPMPAHIRIGEPAAA